MSDVAGRVIHMPLPADLLDLEHAWPRHSGAKEDAIIRQLGLTVPRYYVLLRRAAESIEGQAHDAVTAHRVARHAEVQRRCHHGG
jgi:hypothetical protein